MMTKKKKRRVSKIITRIVSAYAFSEYSKEDAVHVLGVVASNLLIGVCRSTTRPVEVLENFTDLIKEELEKKNDDRDDKVESTGEGLQRQASPVQSGDGQELQTAS